MSVKKTGSFDGIANKFDKNIYGTSKGRLRHLLLQHYLREQLEHPEALCVLDAGAGTGVMAEVFAQAGHELELVDVSEEALAIAKNRLANYPATSFTCNNIMSLKQTYDLILCHALLEWLDDPKTAISYLLDRLNDNGVLSLSFFNQDAKFFGNAIYGNFEYLAKGMKVRNVVRLNPNNPQSPREILSYLETFPYVSIETTAGIRCFHDYMRDINMQNSRFDDILALEKSQGSQEPFKWLGKYFYIKIRKRAQTK